MKHLFTKLIAVATIVVAMSSSAMAQIDPNIYYDTAWVIEGDKNVLERISQEKIHITADGKYCYFNPALYNKSDLIYKFNLETKEITNPYNINCFALSPSLNHFLGDSITASKEEERTIYDLKNGRQIATIFDSCEFYKYSTNGKYLVGYKERYKGAFTSGHSLYVYETTNYKMVKEFSFDENTIFVSDDLTFSPDGNNMLLYSNYSILVQKPFTFHILDLPNMIEYNRNYTEYGTERLATIMNGDTIMYNGGYWSFKEKIINYSEGIYLYRAHENKETFFSHDWAGNGIIKFLSAKLDSESIPIYYRCGKYGYTNKTIYNKYELNLNVLLNGEKPLRSYPEIVKFIGDSILLTYRVANYEEGKRYWMMFVPKLKSSTPNNDKVITLYPNPTISSVSISNLPPEINLRQTITDAIGNILNNEMINTVSGTIQINFSIYPNGQYFIKLENQSFSKTFKVIKGE